jgi:AraC-like DNA-binding protein
MKNAKLPQLEAISPAIGSSFTILNYKEQCNDGAAWHFHPEVELVYVDQGSGKRHIGNHLSYYHDGDLIFIGANVPHYGFTDRLTGNKSEVVIQLKEDFLGTDYLNAPEFRQINDLFKRGKQGITFYGETKNSVGLKMEAIAHMSPLKKLTALIEILQELAQSKEYNLLNIEKVIIASNPQDNSRLEVLYDFVKREYKRTIALEEMAQLSSMTVPAFSRYFKKKTGKTFTKFVNEHRLVHASKLLAEQPISITDVCFESGFNNFSHFNKLFKEFAGKSPSKYRSEIQKLHE